MERLFGELSRNFQTQQEQQRATPQLGLVHSARCDCVDISRAFGTELHAERPRVAVVTVREYSSALQLAKYSTHLLIS